MDFPYLQAMVVRLSPMSTRLLNKVSIWLKNIQYFLLPGVCVACHQPSHTQFDLCQACHASFIPIEHPCLGCALPLPPDSTTHKLCGKCLRKGAYIQTTVAGFAYQLPVKTLISQYKYQARLQHGRVLTTLLLAEIRQFYQDSQLPAVLLPVPLHPIRLRERGYNQALLIAQQLGAELEIPVLPNLLQRVRHTAAQQGLNAKQRKRNLRGAFALAPNALDLGYSSVVIIDDVVTTMSTVAELARLLHKHSHTELQVHVWCLARA